MKTLRDNKSVVNCDDTCAGRLPGSDFALPCAPALRDPLLCLVQGHGKDTICRKASVRPSFSHPLRGPRSQLCKKAVGAGCSCSQKWNAVPPRKTLSRKWPAMYEDRPHDSQLKTAAGF
jgi:hypothetical protein